MAAIFTRKRALVAGIVVAFVGAFAAIGAVSRSSPTTLAAVTTSAAGAVPSASWYWTMAVAPTDPNVLVLGTETGLYRSGDGGKTWAATGPKGIEATSLVRAGDAIFAGGVPLAAGGAPVIRSATGRVAADGTAVLIESTDGGKTWADLHPRGLPNVSVQALAADPASSTVLYAVLHTGKLYRSTDSGRSFALLAAKTEQTPWALAITEGGRLVAGDMDTGSYVSTDGKAWRSTGFTNSQKSKMVMEYAVAPTDSKRILMSAFGVELSTDGGQTWHVALKTQVMFGPVAWAAGSSGIAYAVGFDSSLWRSGNGGTSWQKVT